VVFTGVSGSGKSSMAFDTLFAEGQRRYIESLSSYARQFLGNMKRPEVDLIEGLSPSIAINQKAISHNPRSTVGTVTEIYDYLRLLFARIGHPHCPNCGREVMPQTSKQIVTQIINTLTQELSRTPYRFLILSPLVRNKPVTSMVWSRISASKVLNGCALTVKLLISTPILASLKPINMILMLSATASQFPKNL